MTLQTFDRPTPPEWREELARVSPRSDALGWLHLRWEPGEVITLMETAHGRTLETTYDQRVDRWFLWQIQPVQFIPADILTELNGPHPRSSGAWRPYNREDGTRGAFWTGGPCQLITRQQWEIFRETGGLAFKWWVIQGEHGGHRVELTPPERLMYQVAGFGPDVPRAGTLPYADFDQRVIKAIAQHDHLSEFAGMAGIGSRYGDLVMRHMARMEEAARDRVYEDLYVNTADEYADEIRFALAKEQPALRPIATDEMDRFDADAAKHAFVTGTVTDTDAGVRTIAHTLTPH